MSKLKLVPVLCLLGILFSPLGVQAADGTPFQQLQDQIDNIELTPGPAGADGAGCTISGPIVTCGTDISDVRGPQGLQGPEGPEGPPGTGGLPYVLKNGLGGVVGNLISLDTVTAGEGFGGFAGGLLSADMEVNTSLGTRNIVFAVRGDGKIITPKVNDLLLFQDETCSGPAYVVVTNDIPKEPAFSPALLITGTSALYVDPNSPLPQLLNFIRFKASLLDPSLPCNIINLTNILAYPFSNFELVDSNLLTSNPPPDQKISRVPFQNTDKLRTI